MKQVNHLFVSSLIFTLCLIIWPLFMSVSQPQGNLVERFQWISENQAIFKINFILAFLISPSLIYMMISQLNVSGKNFSRNEMIGFIFLGAYLILCSISYGAQFIIVPGLIKHELHSTAQVMYFDSETSITFLLNQTGYFFWALGALVLFSGFIKTKERLRVIAIIYILSAALSITAYAGLIIQSKILNLMTFASGMVLLPVGIISFIWGVQLNKFRSSATKKPGLIK